jgi:hypothetical protein
MEMVNIDGSSNWITIPNNATDTAGCNGDIALKPEVCCK